MIHWLMCKVGWHMIQIRDGWAWCVHCSWYEELPDPPDSELE